MEGVPFNWNDYLRSEGLSDIAPLGSGMQGAQTGQAGRPIHPATTAEMITEARTPMHEWQDQPLASRHTNNTDGSRGYDTAEHSLLDREEDLIPSAHEIKPIVSQYEYRHHGSTRNPESPEPGCDLAPPEQAPNTTVTPIETGPDGFKQKVHDLGVFPLDQICVCATCLTGWFRFTSGSACDKWQDEHPESRSWTFGCRVTGCQWTTKDHPYKSVDAITLWLHETKSFHYGEPGNWRCREANCKYVSKRFRDFKRHSSSKHCIKPQKFKCPVPGCRFHEDGFVRKDKLDSHEKTVHGGKTQPGKPNQAIKPKLGDSA